MANIYLVEAPISISFSKSCLDMEKFTREYHKLGQTDGGELSKWLKATKMRGEANDSDPVLLHLMIELHKKIDNLEKLIKHEVPNNLKLESIFDIDSIGFEHFKLSQEILVVDEKYYGRLDMPIYPKRDIGIFFQAITPSLAQIIKIHDRDQSAWNLYLRARERVLIREKKESKS